MARKFNLGGDDGDNPKPKRKAHSPHYKADNNGGYGNPPVKGQFAGKPGPGRRTGDQSLRAALRKMFKSKVLLADGSSAPMYDAISKQSKKVMLSSGVKGLEFALKLHEQIMADEHKGEPQPDLTELTDTELYLYGYLAYRTQPRKNGEPRVAWHGLDEIVGRSFRFVTDEETGEVTCEDIPNP